MQSAAEVAAGDERFSAVLTHAFLHHLASDDSTPCSPTSRGCRTAQGRAWFYEPVFYPAGTRTPATAVKLAEAKLAGMVAARRRARSEATSARSPRRSGSTTRPTSAAGSSLPRRCRSSPASCIHALSRHFEIDEAVWATTTSYAVAQSASLLRSGAARRGLGRALVRPWARADLAFGGAGRVGMYRGLPGYGFMAVSCRRRGAES